MSFRYYPMYLKGNPQLRIYLPNFWMKLVRPEEGEPLNQVKFKTPVEMTNWDIRNYLEKIYKVPVVSIKSKIFMGETKRAPGKAYIIKDDDYRLAIVAMDESKQFIWPNLFPEKKVEEEKDEEKKFKESMELNAKAQKRTHWSRGPVPPWFGL